MVIGTKPLEDKSFENSKKVLKATTAFVIVFSIMEVVTYFVYLHCVSMYHVFLLFFLEQVFINKMNGTKCKFSKTFNAQASLSKVTRRVDGSE